jgi:ABC-2 type transport system ATP-binding protein
MRYAVEVKHLVKKYAKSPTPAVDNVSFTVKSGQFFSLLGPNGAGKTTIISILTTLLVRSSGISRVAGFDTENQSSQVRSRIGIIFQRPSLDQNLTAEENVRFHAALYGLYPYYPFYRSMPEAYKQQISQLSAVLGLTAVQLGQPVRTLSGGMKRKLEIVRSLMHRPEILFLDEPTSGLDPQSRRSLWSYLHDIRKSNGTTVFLTTHYLEEAEDCDAVAIINNGKIIAQGSPLAIKKEYAGKKTSLEQAYLNIIEAAQ